MGWRWWYGTRGGETAEQCPARTLYPIACRESRGAQMLAKMAFGGGGGWSWRPTDARQAMGQPADAPTASLRASTRFVASQGKPSRPKWPWKEVAR